MVIYGELSSAEKKNAVSKPFKNRHLMASAIKISYNNPIN